ncbi:MAG: PhoH family protein [Holosporales bacterium]
MVTQPKTALELEFDDNRLLPVLFGEKDQYLRRIERTLNVEVIARGNRVLIEGSSGDAAVAHTVLSRLYDRLRRGLVISNAEVDAAIRIAQMNPHGSGSVMKTSSPQDLDMSITTRRRVVTPRTPGQAHYIQALQSHELVFGIGPAGTGKTYLAVATAVAMLLSGQVSRIILSRPAVEAGERLGFLPGDLREKIDPYLRPLYDALYDMLPAEQVARRIASHEIEVAPLAFMRGRTLANAFVILDEAQNTTIMQMKMFLTRLGENSRMVVTGDLSQIDLPHGVPSGLRHALEVLKGVEGVGLTYFDEGDVVRHPLVGRIVKAYNQADSKSQEHI